MCYSTLVCGTVLSILLGATAADAAHLAPEQEITYRVDSITTFYPPISALISGNDTVYSGCGAGIYAQFGKGQAWQKIIGTECEGDNWYGDCYMIDKLKRLFRPGQMWRLPSTDQLLVYDAWCDVILEIESSPDQPAFAKIWRRPWDESYLSGLSIQGDLMLSNGTSKLGSHIDMRKVSDPDFFKRIFMVPLSRKAKLDSIGVYWPNCRPVLNPVDSTIWVEIYGFDYLYILDFDGNLIDSVKIAADGWIAPGKPASRIQTQAVADEWLSRWTPQTTFNYVPPGYFIMQFRIGWLHVSDDSLPLCGDNRASLCGTAVWNADDRQPVALEVDHRWRVAGVQPDGRIIFGHYEREADTYRVVLDITRIER